MHYKLTTLIVLLGMSLIFTLPAEAGHGAGPAKLITEAHGKLAARWWQYITSFSADESPQFADGEVDCTARQNGPVIFLAGGQGGTTAVRSCTVPRKPLFFPLANFLFDNAPGEIPASVEEKRAILDGVLSDTEPGAFADAGFPGSRACGLIATLDGEPVSYHAPIVRVQSPPFLLVTGSDAVPPDANDPEAITDGYWVLLPRLASGEHTLRFVGRLCQFDNFEDHPFFGPIDITYHLTVQ